MQKHKNDIHLDVRNLPNETEIKGSKGLGVFLIVFSLFWGGMPTFFLLQSILSETFEPGMLFILLFTIIGIGIFLFGLNQLFIRGWQHIHKDCIEMDKTTLFGRKQWRESIKNYEGVISKSEFHSGGKNRASYTLYIVELFHSDKQKIVRLYQSRSKANFRSIWEDYCRALNMPALEEGDEEMIRRDVEDLDKSVRELVAEKKINVEFDPSANPPEHITLSVEDHLLKITIEKKRISIFGFLFSFLFSGAFVYMGFFVDKCPFLFGIMGVLMGLILLGFGIWCLVSKPQARLSKDGVHIFYLTPWGETPGTHIHAQQIEQISIKKVLNKRRKAVVISTDFQEKTFGHGLNKKSLEWLKNCILAVVSA